MVEKKMKQWLQVIGPWSYMAGVVIAVFAGFVLPANQNVITVLAALGFIVGLLNIRDIEKTKFLIGVLTLLAAGMYINLLTSNIQYIGQQIYNSVNYMIIFTIPGAVVVSLKVIHEVAS
ncbi:MAG: hypothetical protein QXH30_03545 [Candidatus Bilamarchaeaceae archaeon]